MSTQQTITREITARRRRNAEKQFDMRMTGGDLHFVADFVKGSAFFVESLEEHIGEDLTDFWQQREHALRILTDWMMQSMDTPLVTAKAA